MSEKKTVKNFFSLSIETFFSPEEKRDYLEFGVPYKRVIFLYGVPGSGKTTTIGKIVNKIFLITLIQLQINVFKIVKRTIFAIYSWTKTH